MTEYFYLMLYLTFWAVVIPATAIFCLSYVFYQFWLWANKKLDQQLEFLNE